MSAEKQEYSSNRVALDLEEIVISSNELLEKIKLFLGERSESLEPIEIQERYLVRTIAKLGELAAFIRDDTSIQGEANQELKKVAKFFTMHRNKLLKHYIYERYLKDNSKLLENAKSYIKQKHELYIQLLNSLMISFGMSNKNDNIGNENQGLSKVERRDLVKEKKSAKLVDYTYDEVQYLYCCNREICSLEDKIKFYTKCSVKDKNFYSKFVQIFDTESQNHKYFLNGGLANYYENILTMIIDFNDFFHKKIKNDDSKKEFSNYQKGLYNKLGQKHKELFRQRRRRNNVAHNLTMEIDPHEYKVHILRFVELNDQFFKPLSEFYKNLGMTLENKVLLQQEKKSIEISKIFDPALSGQEEKGEFTDSNTNVLAGSGIIQLEESEQKTLDEINKNQPESESQSLLSINEFDFAYMMAANKATLWNSSKKEEKEDKPDEKEETTVEKKRLSEDFIDDRPTKKIKLKKEPT